MLTFTGHLQSVSSNGIISFNPPKEYNEIDIIPILQGGHEGKHLCLLHVYRFSAPRPSFLLACLLANPYAAGSLQATSPGTLNQLLSYSASRRQTMEKRKPKKGKQSFFRAPLLLQLQSSPASSLSPLSHSQCLFI